MKKTVYAILLLGFVSLTLTACTKKVGEKGVTENGGAKETTANEGETFSSSLKDLMNLGRSVKCTYEFSDGQVTSKGVTYVSGEKTRSEATVVTPEGEEIISNTIVEGNTMYSWSDQDKKGIKITWSDEDMDEDMDLPEAGDSYEYNDLNKEMDYKCSPWIPDNSKFEAPNDVEFVDYNQMINDTMKMMEDMNIPSME
jgi:hypothetical protein